MKEVIQATKHQGMLSNHMRFNSQGLIKILKQNPA